MCRLCDHVCILLPDGFYRQVKQISGAHNKAEANPLTRTKKRRSSTRGMAPSVVGFFNNLTHLIKVLLHRGKADLRASCLSCRIPSRASQWFCFRISTPSSLLGLSMGKKPPVLVSKNPASHSKWQTAIFIFLFLCLNQSNQDVGSEEELHRTPPGSCSAADVPVPGVLHAHATGSVLHNAGHHVHLNMQTTRIS